MRPINQPQQMFMPHCGEPPSPFSIFLRSRHHQIPQVTDVRDLGVPLNTTFSTSAHCREAANTTRRLLFMVLKSFCKLSKTAFIPLYGTLVQPHLEYAMEANAPTLRTAINQREMVQRLAKRLVRGRQFNLFSLERRRLRADLILAFEIFNGEVDLNPSDFFLRPPEPGYEGTPTDYCKDQAVYDAGAVPFQFGS